MWIHIRTDTHRHTRADLLIHSELSLCSGYCHSFHYINSFLSPSSSFLSFSLSLCVYLCSRKPFKKLKLREKSKAATKSTIWFNDYDNHCRKTTDKLCEKAAFDRNISSDVSTVNSSSTNRITSTSTPNQHHIRIAVDFDYEKCAVNKHLELLHSSLSSSTSTVSDQDKRQVEAYNELVSLQQLYDQQQNFREKAIDVPKEFEENAYSDNNQQNGWSLRHRRSSQYSLVSVRTPIKLTSLNVCITYITSTSFHHQNSFRGKFVHFAEP